MKQNYVVDWEVSCRGFYYVKTIDVSEDESFNLYWEADGMNLVEKILRSNYCDINYENISVTDISGNPLIDTSIPMSNLLCYRSNKMPYKKF